jgi:peptidoglycan/xylan/chitin deacetylase (PgdA/CDA1 family)
MGPATIRNYTHAVMFHHFHDERHPAGQGALSAEQFSSMLDWLSNRYCLLDADEYLYRVKRRTTGSRDICLTFDDALLCQSEIAIPILKAKGLKAFFFVYSSPFMGDPDYLEIYRYFRTSEFTSVDDFYREFSAHVRKLIGNEYERAEAGYDEREYLKAYPFYTHNDKWFRYLRDHTLGKERYEEVMRTLMRSHGFEPKNVLAKLWMNNQSLRDIQSDGHLLGLHSYSHPTMLHLLDNASQETEYRRNYQHLREVLNVAPCSMSHPCGNYTDATLQILSAQDIEIGFRSNSSVTDVRSSLEIPREDHANILKEMAE